MSLVFAGVCSHAPGYPPGEPRRPGDALAFHSEFHAMGTPLAETRPMRSRHRRQNFANLSSKTPATRGMATAT